MIEIIRPRTGARLRVALLDFDGTLSLVRGGWQHVMLRLMLATLGPLAPAEPMAELEARVAATIERLTGHPTIHQMRWLAAEAARLGAAPAAPETYAERYQALLGALVEQRLAALRAGQTTADALMVPGAAPFLAELERRGALLALASGTEQAEVLREARALGIAAPFGARIHGPGPHAPDFSKRAVIEQLIAELQIPGQAIVAIGDGPVELAAIRAAGGYAVGVALDELRGRGLDQRKRASLIAAGADLIVPDLAVPGLAAYLFDRPPDTTGDPSHEAHHALPNL